MEIVADTSTPSTFKLELDSNSIHNSGLAVIALAKCCISGMTVSFQTSNDGERGPYPSFVDARGPASAEDIRSVACAIAAAKRIVVVCGEW